jgi:hypothetical protein
VRDLTISTGLGGGPITLRWADGGAEAAYVIARIDGTAPPVLLPPGGLLPADASSYVDQSAPANGSVCYLLIPLSAFGALGHSDMLCVWLGIAAGSAVEGQIALRLDESTNATLSWTVPSGPDALVLYWLTNAGAVPIPLSPSATGWVQNVQDQPSCFLLVGQAGSVPLWTTNLVCGART